MPLYLVTRTVEAVVYAKDEREARDVGEDAVREEIRNGDPYDAEVDPLPLRLPDGWDEASLVYKRDPSTDLTVAEARKLP